MGWRLLRRIERGGRVAENYEKETDEIYELDSAEDFDAFLVSFKKKGGIVVEKRRGLSFYYCVDDVEVTRRPPTATGRVQAVARIRLSLLSGGERDAPPWELPPYALRVSTKSIEETTSRFYPGVGDILVPRSSYSPVPLTNTAGVRIPARTTRGVSLIEFAYNVPVSAFDSRLFWQAQGKINLLTVAVCGMTFPPRTIRLESFAMRYMTATTQTQDASGSTTETTWKYYRVDVGLLANPRSYDQLFANTGLHVKRNGKLSRIWRWTGSDGARYGTYKEYQASGSRDGEPIAEPAPLDASGENVAPVATWRVGSPYEPADFKALGLPTQGPTQWSVPIAE